MAKTVSEMSISLEGFITGPDDTAEQGLGRGGEVLHEWIFRKPGTFDEIIAAARADTGCLLTGRHSYEVAGGWGEEPPFQMPIFVLTHRPQAPIAKKGGTTFHFVTDGLESGLRQAEKVAGGRNIGVPGATVAQQLLRIGRLDEIYLHVVPVLLGAGKRLFEERDPRRVDLELISSEPGDDVLHVRYRVLGQG